MGVAYPDNKDFKSILLCNWWSELKEKSRNDHWMTFPDLDGYFHRACAICAKSWWIVPEKSG